VAIIGAGRVGTALAVLLEHAGRRIVMASGGERSRARASRYLPSTPFFHVSDAADPARRAALIVLSLPDGSLAEVCAALAQGGAFLPAQFVLHLSGSLGLDVLRPAEEAGAEVLSLHPLQAFPDVDEGIARLPGSHIAVTARTEIGTSTGEAIATDVGGHPFRLSDDGKPLYHAGAVFASNYIVASLGTADRLLRLAGLDEPGELLAPLARAVLDVTLSRGPGEALTGPAARGDTQTVARHLAALSSGAPDVVESYVALARAAARLASEAGRLSEEGRLALEEELARWR
jgi:predicted short-subunit dehydrogenase-like oxidoreductase (DUF2520 family)